MKTFKILLAGILLLTTALYTHAIPAYPGWMRHIQPDGTVIRYQILGDEHCHAFISEEGRRLYLTDDGWMKYDSDVESFDFKSYYQQQVSKKLNRDLLDQDFPTIGTIRGIVLLVEFSDKEFCEEYTREVYDSMMNQAGFSLFDGTGSAKDYFNDQSQGLFNPEFDVAGPIKLSHNMKYYGDNRNEGGDDIRPAEMVRDACQIAHDSLNIDFSVYDNNNDGDIDFVYIIYAGYAESNGAPASTIWPHASDVNSHGIRLALDGKNLRRYACSAELRGVVSHVMDGIGTLCHEFSHILGLPDIYNIRNSRDVQLGPWDVMDNGCYNNNSRTPASFSAFERHQLGWLDFQTLDEPMEEVQLPELTTSNVAYLIPTAHENEFFTLENRQCVGWDAYLPGKGLMILHIDYDTLMWNRNNVNNGLHPRYDLVEADLRANGLGSSNLYPTAYNNKFTDYSNPNSLTWDGTPTEKGITDIRVEDGVVKFSFMNDKLPRPRQLQATDITPTTARMLWQSVDRAGSYELDITEELPDSLSPIILDEDFSLMTDGKYPNADTHELSREMDSHTHTSGWTGKNVYSAGGYVRVGVYGGIGSLTTPTLNLSAKGDSCFMAFHAVSYPGKSVNYTVSLYDQAKGTEVESYTFKARKDEEPVVIVWHEVSEAATITISTKNERLFLNDIRILSDTLQGIWTAGPKNWTVADIHDCEYMLEGLQPHRAYYCKVRAMGNGQIGDSPWSDLLQFTTQVPDGIQETPPLLTGHESWYDLNGRPVIHPAHGIYIRRVTDAEGRVSVSKIIR